MSSYRQRSDTHRKRNYCTAYSRSPESPVLALSQRPAPPRPRAEREKQHETQPTSRPTQQTRSSTRVIGPVCRVPPGLRVWNVSSVGACRERAGSTSPASSVLE
eukprot:2433748-Prymnesium_polylepis.2